jgi:hypothetical protein
MNVITKAVVVLESLGLFSPTLAIQHSAATPGGLGTILS